MGIWRSTPRRRCPKTLRRRGQSRCGETPEGTPVLVAVFQISVFDRDQGPCGIGMPPVSGRAIRVITLHHNGVSQTTTIWPVRIAGGAVDASASTLRLED